MHLTLNEHDDDGDIIDFDGRNNVQTVGILSPLANVYQIISVGKTAPRISSVTRSVDRFYRPPLS